MGNDGGSVAKRRDLVAKASPKQTRKLSNTDLWTLCTLSGRALEDPVVSDWQGRLYNKESVLELLVGERERSGDCDIQSTKDFVVLKREFAKGSWICPVSHMDIVSEGSGRTIVYIVPCGHCGDEQALISDGKCQVCKAQVRENAKVILNPRDLTEMKARRDRLAASGLPHSMKSRKRKLAQAQV